MGVHESQSLLWERMVALGLPFSRYLAPKLAAAFPQLPDLQVGNSCCARYIDAEWALQEDTQPCLGTARCDLTLYMTSVMSALLGWNSGLGCATMSYICRQSSFTGP